MRIVCATHQDVKALAASGRFRDDLYYRLGEIVLRIPPLRERSGDSLLLAHHFRHRYCASEGRSQLHFSAEALQQIEAHDWPGNVREVENCIRRAVIMCDGAQIAAADLGLPGGAEAQAGPDYSLRQAREAAEYGAMVRALARSDGNIARAATLLGVSRPTLYDLMRHHGVK